MLSSSFLAENSSYIENVMRHRFVHDVSRILLLREIPLLVTVSRAEVDDAGIDLVMSVGAVTRQIQMKTLSSTMTGNPYAIAESLGGIPGACVVWMCYDRQTLEPTVYHLMGSRGNAPLRDLSVLPAATRKRNGIKVSRDGYRAVRIRNAEERNLNLAKLTDVLFDLT